MQCFVLGAVEAAQTGIGKDLTSWLREVALSWAD